MMADLIYQGGNRAKATNDTAVYIRQNFVTADATGAMSLNSEGLSGWLREQLAELTSTIPSGGMSLGIVDVSSLVDNLAPKFRVEYWRNQTGYPTGAGAFSVSSLRTSMNALRSASNALSNFYASLGMDVKLNALALGSFNDSGTPLPDVVERIVEPRAYIQTFVNDWGEESAPSKPSEVKDVDQNDDCDVNLALPEPGRNIKLWRLYRAKSGSQSAAFLFVDEGSAGQTLYSDKKKATELQEVCPTFTWEQPPIELLGLTGMPNGMMAGYFGNTVAFCEPYKGYAWPVDYWKTTEHPIIGLGSFENVLFVGTSGNPYFMEGVESASVSVRKLTVNQSCASGDSIVSMDGGVMFASPDGLCFASLRGIEVVTANHFTREDWQKLNPSSIVAGQHDGSYHFTYSGGAAGAGCYAFHLASRKLVAVDTLGSATFTDRVTDTLYMASGRVIRAMFASPARRVAVGQTKVIRLQAYAGFAWLEVLSDFSDAVRIDIKADGAPWYSSVLTHKGPHRLPAGRFMQYEITLTTAARVALLTLASSTAELQATP